MAVSKTNIGNMALSHLAIGKTIANINTEQSEEAIALRIFYDVALEATIRDFPWPFTSRVSALALVEENPTDEWAYSYRYPTDCLMVRRILSAIRNDNRQSRIPYKIMSDGQGTVIYSDQEDATMEYTLNFTDTQFFPPDFTLAFSYYLAHLIAPKLMSGDRFKLGDKVLGLYRLELSRAASRAFNEQQEEELPESEFIRARD